MNRDYRKSSRSCQICEVLSMSVDVLALMFFAVNLRNLVDTSMEISYSFCERILLSLRRRRDRPEEARQPSSKPLMNGANLQDIMMSWPIRGERRMEPFLFLAGKGFFIMPNNRKWDEYP